MSVLRWHALSGYSLELTQFTGGRVTIVGGTRALLDAIGSGARFEHRLGAAVRSVTQRNGQVEVQTSDGSGFAARAVIVAVPLNALGQIDFTPGLSEDKQRAIASRCSTNPVRRSRPTYHAATSTSSETATSSPARVISDHVCG